MSRDYYLGLDMGTSSVGWAVTDKEYHLLRAKGKDLWGVRLFDEAKTAAERRSHRVTRRRRARERARIGFLKEVFRQEIEKVDPSFFQRIDESMLHKEDKSIEGQYTLFMDSDFTDKDYFKAYPTIFHLRKELSESADPHDIRLVYLALLNMYKHRGHFLNEGLSTEEMPSLEELWNRLCELQPRFERAGEFNKIKETLSKGDISRSERRDKLLSILDVDKKSQESQMLNAICGLQADLRKMFDEEHLEGMEVEKVCFRSSDYEEKEEILVEGLDKELFETLLCLKRIHDQSLLDNIKQGYETISQARVASYEKHKKDLDCLKRVMKKNSPDEYHKMFRVMEDNNYSAYVGWVDYKNHKIRRAANCDEEKFFSSIKKIITAMKQDGDTTYILEEIESESFLPKQLTSANGVIPNQVYVTEMEMILRNASEYLSFLKEVDGSGLSVSQRIVEMFRFHVPYYIGPLQNKEENHAWVVRRKEGRIYPWNFSEMVDENQTHEAFIEQLIRRDTYLNDSKVLPKNSLLYEKYMVLNELNNLRINGELSVGLKQQLFNELFRRGRKVTAKKLISFLRQEGLIGVGDEPVITGIDQNFVHTCSSYASFCGILGVETLSYNQEKMVEDIIRLGTIYGAARNVFKRRIMDQYKDSLDKKQLDRIAGMRFRDWGRLSRELLELEGADKSTGEVKTIIRRMWDDNKNLMQLLSDDYTYMQEISDRVSGIEKTLWDLSYEDLRELYISAPVRRMVWQTIKIIRELTNVLGEGPKRIFIEMAREGNAPKKRTVSRKKKFEELYRACGKEGKEFLKTIQGTEEYRFKSKKLYLYYTQMGRCMYTGERIDLQKLFNDNIYDIDHVYPRHFVKDDSLENNLVLVKKRENAEKRDTYPIDATIQETQHTFWGDLRERELISKEKYNRLMRTYGFTPEERAAFINRQLVETRQGTKVVADILKKALPNCEIVYTKAGNVSDFRHHFNLIKCREVNSFHHANDAYLNIVVGNAYYVKFTRDPRRFIEEYDADREKNAYHMDPERFFKYSIKRGNDVGWLAENGESIGIVKKTMEKMTPLITRRSYEAHGGLANQQLTSASTIQKSKGNSYLPRQKEGLISDTRKYGGYSDILGAFFFVVEHTEKSKRVRTIETLPFAVSTKIMSEGDLLEYCSQRLGLKDAKIIYQRIAKYSLMDVDGFSVYITGRTGERLSVINGIELKMSSNDAHYLRNVFKVVDEKLDSEQIVERGIGLQDPITISRNEEVYHMLMRKYMEGVYKNRPAGIGTLLQKGMDQFRELALDEQCYVLSQVVKLSNNAKADADLKRIGGSGQSGKATVSKKISSNKNVYLICRSVTGLYEKRVDLLEGFD